MTSALTSRARVLLCVFLAIGGAFTVAPLLWILVRAFSPSADIFSAMSAGGLSTFIPTNVTLGNITGVFTGPLLRAVVNSVIVTFVTVLVGLLINAMAAYALSALNVPGRQAVFAIVVLSFMIPFDAVAIPLSNVVRGVGLDNTYAALILPGLGNGLAIFLIRQFFLGIPPDLAEAARIDGAGHWRIFTRIYLPISQNALIGAGLILFLFQWQSYLWPLLVTSDPNMDVGAVALARLFGEYVVDWGGLFAAALVLTVIPILIVLRFQRHLVNSVAATGSKG